MNVSTSKTDEIDKNLRAFIVALPSVLKEHQGKCALMRHGEIVAFYESAIDAQIAGNRTFADEIFSIQQVSDQAEELGRYAHALPPRTA